MVTLGWGLNKPLALLFDPFESVVSYIQVEKSVTGLPSLSGALHLRQVIFVALKLMLRLRSSSNNEPRHGRREV